MELRTEISSWHIHVTSGCSLLLRCRSVGGVGVASYGSVARQSRPGWRQHLFLQLLKQKAGHYRSERVESRDVCVHATQSDAAAVVWNRLNTLQCHIFIIIRTSSAAVRLSTSSYQAPLKHLTHYFGFYRLFRDLEVIVTYVTLM